MERAGVDAVRREIARRKWREEIRAMAIAAQIPGDSTAVSLDDAFAFLPVEEIAEAIEQACFDFAGMRGNGTLPRDGDVLEPAIEYAVVYNKRELTDRLNAAVLVGLSNGNLVGTGYDSRSPLDASRVRIPADRWAGLSVDFKRSVATGDGFGLSQIEVKVSREAAKAKGRPNAESMSIALFNARRAAGVLLASQKAEAEAITQTWPSDGPKVPQVKTVSQHISAVWHAAKHAPC